MDWSTFVAAVLGSSTLSAVIASWLDRRSAESRAREDRFTANADAVRDALAALRSGYQTGAEANSVVALENAFEAAAAKCDSESLWDQAKAYEEVGRSWAAGDPDVNREAEELAYERVQRAIRRRTARFLPRGTR